VEGVALPFLFIPSYPAANTSIKSLGKSASI